MSPTCPGSSPTSGPAPAAASDKTQTLFVETANFLFTKNSLDLDRASGVIIYLDQPASSETGGDCPPPFCTVSPHWDLSPIPFCPPGGENSPFLFWLLGKGCFWSLPGCGFAAAFPLCEDLGPAWSPVLRRAIGCKHPCLSCAGRFCAPAEGCGRPCRLLRRKNPCLGRAGRFCAPAGGCGRPCRAVRGGIFSLIRKERPGSSLAGKAPACYLSSIGLMKRPGPPSGTFRNQISTSKSHIQGHLS